MAYDRYDSDRDRGWRGRDDDNRHRGRRDERGFMERAGDEISSWFGSDDRERGRGLERNDRGWFGGEHEGRNRDYDRGYGRDYDRDRDEQSSGGFWHERGGNEQARPMRWTSSGRDYRSGYDRDEERSYGSRYSGGYDRGDERGSRSGSSGGNYRPMAGDYGRTGDYGRPGGYDRSESPWGRDDYRRTQYAGSSRDEDRHYRAWRDRQAEELDRDYHEYSRERGERFESDFGSWRNQRQQQRERLGSIREHMDVVGNDGERVGRVDCVRGDRVILTKSDSEDGHHHSIPCSMIESIDNDQVRLNVSASQTKDRWRDEDRDRALFEDRDRGGDGPHNLERSFHGTYR